MTVFLLIYVFNIFLSLFACLSGLWASLPEIKIDDDDDDYSASRRHSGDVMVGNRVDINRDFLIKIKKSVF